MLTTEKINELLGIEENYKAPERMLSMILDSERKESLLESFLEVEQDLSYEWFQNYFEDEHSERKAKKQDFTPIGISNLLSRIAGNQESYFEATAGTGGIAIQFWNNNPSAFYQLEELSDRAIPFLLFNMMIRNISGLVYHGNSLTREWKSIYELKSSNKFSTIKRIEVVENYG